jgi:uncharacterized protein DUF4953/uncharacterized protein DUF5117
LNLRSLARPVLILLTLLLLLAPPAAGPAAGSPRKKGDDSPKSAPDNGDKKPLADVIKGQEKMEGFLTLYKSPQRLLADVPDSLLGKQLGLSGLLVKAVGDWAVRGGGIETQVVSFSKVGERVVLTKRNLEYQASASSPFRVAVDATFPDSPAFLTKAIPVAEERPVTLVDLAGLFSSDLIQIMPPESGYASSPDDASIAAVNDNPDNLVVRVHYRFRQQRDPGGRGDGESPRRGALPLRLADPRSMEVSVDYNLFRLPDDGFRPRKSDERIGGFDTAYKDYTDVSGRDSAFRHYFSRWKVEKSDPSAQLSPAKEPITFYIDRATPAEWRPRIREATVWWNRAFEKIGIQNAVRVLDQPEDPDWDPTDIHHSMIYWNLSDNLFFSGMAGPMVTDPRTGQILKANAYLNGEFPSYTLHRYLVYAWWRAPQTASPLEDPFLLPATAGIASRVFDASRPGTPRACDFSPSFSSQIAFARLVLQSRGVLGKNAEEGDRFAREAFAELTAHEIGHALGFAHNFKASLISDAGDVAAGRVSGNPEAKPFTGSIMDYNPINLAPPGAPQGDYFMHSVGAYDDLAVEYLYAPLDRMTPEQEEQELARIARRAETTPGLMFDDGRLSEIDPSSNTDDLGSDPLRFAETRLTMIQKEVLPRLPELVVEEGHDYSAIRQALDAAIFSVAMDYIDITARHVGGQTTRKIVAEGRAKPPAAPIFPVDPAVQRRALVILDRQVFDPGAFAGSPELLASLKSDLLFDWNYPYRFASDYSLDSRVAFLYDSALSTLFEPRRLARVLDNERRSPRGASPLTLPELFSHVESTAFAGLEKAGVSRDRESIPSRRRTLQRLYVARLGGLVLAPARGTPAEAGQVARRTLQEVRSRIRRVTGSPQRLAALDAYSRAHLEDLDASITRVMEVKMQLKPGS